MGWDIRLRLHVPVHIAYGSRSSLFVHVRFASLTTYATGCFHVCATCVLASALFGGGGGGDDDAPVHETQVPAEWKGAKRSLRYFS
jgi:hypothetical protein